MDTMEALLTRRSIRKYRPEPVPVEDLKEILAAGATAPSAVNMQHWYFVAVQDPAALEEVKAIMGGVVEKFQPVLFPPPGADRHHQPLPVHPGRGAGVPAGFHAQAGLSRPGRSHAERVRRHRERAAGGLGQGHRLLLAVRAPAYGLRPCVPAPLRPRQGGVRGSGHPGLPRPAAQNAAPAGRPLSDRIRRSFH